MTTTTTRENILRCPPTEAVRHTRAFLRAVANVGDAANAERRTHRETRRTRRDSQQRDVDEEPRRPFTNGSLRRAFTTTPSVVDDENEDEEVGERRARFLRCARLFAGCFQNAKMARKQAAAWRRNATRAIQLQRRAECCAVGAQSSSSSTSFVRLPDALSIAASCAYASNLIVL